MRLAIYSDLHLEFIPLGDRPAPPLPDDADVVVLAGDIHQGILGLQWAKYEWPGLPIVFVPGNHEFYGAHLFEALAEMRQVAERLGIHLLANNVATLGDVRFLGTPLWTDFSLAGTPHDSALDARCDISDFRRIRENNGCLTTNTMAQLNREARAFLREELQKPWAGKTVVVTHWLPHPDCIAPQFRESELSPYFCCDCSDLLNDFNIDVWAYGHSHGSRDFVHPSGCRIISNQRGYPSESAVASGFRRDCVVEI